MTNEECRRVTGEINGDQLDGLFYVLMRDHLPAGVLERIIEDLEKSGGQVINFTNGHLASYAKLLRSRVDELFPQGD